MNTANLRKNSRTAGHISIEPLELRIAPAALIFANQEASGYGTSTPIATDSSGNIIVAGVFDGFISLGSDSNPTQLLTVETGGTGQPSGSDIYVAKYAPDGSLLWAQSWGGVPFGGANGPQEIVESLAVDASGDVYVLATFSTQDAGFGGVGTLEEIGGVANDTVVLKLNGLDGAPILSFANQGMLQWGGSGNDVGGGIAVSGSGLFFTGSYDSANPRLGSIPGFTAAAGGTDTYVIQVNAADGTPVSAFGNQGLVAIGTAANEGGKDVVAAPGQSIFVLTAEAGQSQVVKLSTVNGAPLASFGTNGVLPIPNVAAIAVDPLGRLLATGGIQNPGGYLKRFDGANGTPDLTLAGDGTVDFGTNAQRGLSIATDAAGTITVAGVKSVQTGVKSTYFIARFDDAGVPDTGFESSGRAYFGATGNDEQREINVALGPTGHIHVRGLFSGEADLDPTKGKLTVFAATPSVEAGHPDLDAFIASIDPNGVDPSNPYTFTDLSGDIVKVTFKGSGRLSVTPGVTPGVDIERIEAIDTSFDTRLSIKVNGSVGTTTIAHIVTPGAEQHIGILKLSNNVILGSGLSELEPALQITGTSTKILLADVNQNAVIKLGEGLPYNFVGDDTTPDTYNHAPFIKMRDVLGDGVVIDVTGDGNGNGGGGLGLIRVNNWMGEGLIKTTQSIKAYKQRFGDAYVVFEVDKFGVGSGTRADMGSITITGGSWGSSGSEIEGNCGSFSCADFLAGASITAGNINKFLVKTGSYDGTVTLKDPSAGSLGTFKVKSDFTGYVDSTNSIINIKVSGDFKGSLVAPSIGKIQAFSFDGATTMDLYGDPLRHQIIAQSGSLGKLQTKGGGIANYEIEALTVIDQIKVSTGSGTNSSLTGIENTRFIGSEIGSTSISLKPAVGAGAITLIAMKDVIYDMESTIGKITASHSIQNSQLSAGTNFDKITVGNSTFATEGISGSKFLAGSNLGGDGLIDGDETWKRSGHIGKITIYGALTTTTFSAGVDPVNGIFGDGDDALGAGAAGGAVSIDSIIVGAGSGILTGGSVLTHTWAIQGDTLKDIKVNGTKVTLTGLPKHLQIAGAEAVSDIIIRKI